MAQPVVLFPDATALAISAIVAGFITQSESVVVDNQVPVPRPVELVTVRRVGGPIRDLVTDDARLSIETWAATVARAMDLAQLARAFVHAMRGSTVDGYAVYRVTELLGPTELPDPNSTSPRVAQTVQVAVRGAAL